MFKFSSFSSGCLGNPLIQDQAELKEFINKSAGTQPRETSGLVVVQLNRSSALKALGSLSRIVWASCPKITCVAVALEGKQLLISCNKQDNIEELERFIATAREDKIIEADVIK